MPWTTSAPRVHRYRLSLLPTSERRYLLGTMYRLTVLSERWVTSRHSLLLYVRRGQLPGYRFHGNVVVNGADALEFMDRAWPEYALGVPEPDFTGRHWQRLCLADRCAFLLQLRRPVDVASSLGLGLAVTQALVREGQLRARIRPRACFSGVPRGNSFAVTAADIIHFLDHSAPMLGSGEPASLRPSAKIVNSTR